MIIGIIGGGQLARMLILAGYPLGLRFIVLDPSADACAGQISNFIQADYDDEQALRKLAEEADVVTFEFENIPDRSIQFLEEQLPVFPPHKALSIAQDRLREKTLFRQIDIPTPKFLAIDSRGDLEFATVELGFPFFLKTRTLGYDGKGQMLLSSDKDIDSAWLKLGGVPLIAEKFVRFDREISVIAARSQCGETAFYPVPENTHINGILHHSICRPGDPQQRVAESYSARLMDALNYTGVLALELFDVDGHLVANEIAPRVHNSGHWTIEGAEISQFENHLRSVSGLALGSTKATGCSAMVNFIDKLPNRAKLLSKPFVHFHAYGKAPRPGRKVGHATVCATDSGKLDEKLRPLLEIARATAKT